MRKGKDWWKLDKPKVLIQVYLMDDGKIGVSSTSTNQVTNLGLIGVAQAMFLKGVNESPKQEESRIFVPE